MKNEFLHFLHTIEGSTFRKPTESELQTLQTLSGGRLPAMFWEAYSEEIPAAETECDAIIFYGIDRIADENTEYIPGANLLPLGFFTFASAFEGDSVCFDMNDPDFPVYLVSHESMNGEDDIWYYENDTVHYVPFNYENVVRYANKLADSFAEFTANMQEAADNADE